MSTILLRRQVLCAVLMLGALFALDACGKRSGLQPPPGESSDFPRQYPNPAQYPRPDLTHGTRTQESSPPERQPLSSPTDSGSTMSPGMESVQPQ